MKRIIFIIIAGLVFSTYSCMKIPHDLPYPVRQLIRKQARKEGRICYVYQYDYLGQIVYTLRVCDAALVGDTSPVYNENGQQICYLDSRTGGDCIDWDKALYMRTYYLY
ncbi:MAG: hypothetical protein LBL18_03090 [Bacteroidales bacterium]|jgi:hypothetical protein|nr:hypothetical protein [Bacteroidales bacterium]